MAEAQQAAANGKADATQLAVFDDGAVSYDEYEQSMTRAFECDRDAGATVTVLPSSHRNGTTVIEYQIAYGDNVQGAVIDDCYQRYAAYVDGYWQVGGPEAMAFEERRTKALLPALRDCLTKYGVDWADDETFMDLELKAFSKDTDPVEFNCMHEIGYQNWQG